jgi:hypothetical protein
MTDCQADELRRKLEKYLLNAGPSFADIAVCGAGGEKVRDTARRYHSDALHFLAKGEYVNAFAALEYAEGWLDAGVATGVVTAPNKDRDRL